MIHRSDPAAIVSAIIEKSRAGKIAWLATEEDDTFVVSIPGICTLRVALLRTQAQNQLGDLDSLSVPTLTMLNEKSRPIWSVDSRQVSELRELHRLAQNRANRVDDKIAALMDSLRKL